MVNSRKMSFGVADTMMGDSGKLSAASLGQGRPTVPVKYNEMRREHREL